MRTLANNGAHAATNATTQMLIVLRDNPKVRLLFTLAEGLYRIVAKRSAGVAESDVTIVSASATGMAAAMMRGETGSRVLQRLLVDRLLEHPTRRAQLVEFVRALAGMTREVQKEPRRFFPLFSRVTGHPEARIARGWEHHAFPLTVPPDLLDIVAEEEKWVAAGQQRAPRSRAELAGFIDTSIIREATGRR